MSFLTLVEWEDSAQPSPEWRFLDDPPEPAVIRCRSVGWIAAENQSVLMLVPNLGNVGTESAQGCGFIRIPKSAILSRKALSEGPE